MASGRRSGNDPTQLVVIDDSYTSDDALEAIGDRWADHLDGATIRLNDIDIDWLRQRRIVRSDQFSARVDAAAGNHLDVLILQGGINDRDGTSVIRAAAEDALVATAGVGYVLTVGPTTGPARDVDAVNGALRDATEAVRLRA